LLSFTLTSENVALLLYAGSDMNMKAGDSVMVLGMDQEYVTGFFRRYSGRARVVVQIGRKDVLHSLRTVFVMLRSGRMQPLTPPTLTRKDSKATPKPKLYDARKNYENQQLLADVIFYGTNIAEAQLLALDDFANGDTACTNTLGSWMRAGGRAQNVWIPNPDADVVEAVRGQGGNAFQGTLEEYLCQVELPPMDVLYLDFCGFLSTHVDTIKLLFSKGVVSPDKRETLIHVTLCKREGNGTLDELHLLLTALCREYLSLKARCLRQAAEHSSKMWKGVFLLKTN
jgi:hypothetical protein